MFEKLPQKVQAINKLNIDIVYPIIVHFQYHYST